MPRATSLVLLAVARVAAWGGRIDNTHILEKKKADSLAWLERNAEEPGVVTLPSGLQYKVLASGPTSGLRPTVSDHITCHYSGSLINMKVFDSSIEKGQIYETQPSKVIPGWTEALQLMRPGDRWMLYIPASLGYGAEDGDPLIPPHSALIYDLQLLSVEPTPSVFAGWTRWGLDAHVYGKITVGDIAAPCMTVWLVIFICVCQHDFKEKKGKKFWKKDE